MKKLVLGGMSALLLATSLQANAQFDPEDMITYRQAGYSFMSWNMGKIKAMAIDGTMAWDPAQVQAAANAIEAIALSGMSVLYAPGTENDIGDTKTNVRPEMFTDAEGVAKVAIAFNQATRDLAAAAKADDRDAVRKAFAATGDGCKGCHDGYRKSK